MQQIDYPPVQQALERLRSLSANVEIQRLAFVRERALRDERNELFGARGRARGRLSPRRSPGHHQGPSRPPRTPPAPPLWTCE